MASDLQNLLAAARVNVAGVPNDSIRSSEFLHHVRIFPITSQVDQINGLGKDFAENNSAGHVCISVLKDSAGDALEPGDIDSTRIASATG